MPKSLRSNTKNIIEAISVKQLLDSFDKQLKLELVSGQKGVNLMINERSLNRPALALTGYLKFFASKRIQLFGAGEMGYLRSLSNEEEAKILRTIFSRKIPCIIISRNLAPSKILKQISNEFNIPLIRSSLASKTLTTELTLLLEDYFAPRTQIHGTLLDVKGTGTLISGESGVGKSECALALIERGYSLVADDLTYIKRINDREIVGTSNELSRGYMECRGLGIINIAELFGVRSVRKEKRVDLVVRFFNWSKGYKEERTGLNDDTVELLGLKIPLIEIPVRPGRDMALLVEVAAMVRALKSMGHDSAKEFNKKLIQEMNKKNYSDN